MYLFNFYFNNTWKLVFPPENRSFGFKTITNRLLFAAGVGREGEDRMRDTAMPAALQNIEQALALLDRVSRFLTIGDDRGGDPLSEIVEASKCLTRARAELVG
jgi:hypothetical protein